MWPFVEILSQNVAGDGGFTRALDRWLVCYRPRPKLETNGLLDSFRLEHFWRRPMGTAICRRQAVQLAGVLAFLSVATFAAAADQQAETGLRTWTDSSGRHTVKATFLELRNDAVRLKKENGDVIQVPLNKLSEADREAAKTLMEKCRAALKSKEGGDDNPFSAPSPPSEPPTVQDVAQTVGKGIVLIAARDHYGATHALGSGFVIDRSGLVATNYHVIENASSASVRFRDGTAVEVVGYRALDKKHDLAVLQTEVPPQEQRGVNAARFRKREAG